MLSYRESLDSWCAPSLSTPKVGAAKAAFQAEGLYHPLLASPVGNDISLARRAILSGSNASGKSTLIKAVALAVLLGQARMAAGAGLE